MDVLEGIIDGLGVVHLPGLQEDREARNGRQTGREVATTGTTRLSGG